MPYVERYFAPRHLDSSLEPCLKKSKLDYSAICKKKKTDVFIPLEAPSEKESSSGVSETGYYGSVKGQHEKTSFGKDFIIGLDNEAKRGSSRNYNSEAHFSRKESKLDYSALCSKRDSEVFIPLETPSENCSPSGFSENSYYGSDKSEYEKERDNFINDFDNEDESGPSKNYSSKAHHTSIESKPDHSELSKKRNAEEYKPLDRSPSGFSETRNYGSDKGKHDPSRVGEDFQYGFYIDKKPGPYKNDCSEPPLSGREDSNNNQQILGLPKTDKLKNNNNSEAAFSETSTAFIGPLYQPPPQVDTLSRTTNNENSKTTSFRITTVVSGKVADETKSEGGMDYEMWQFYKELHQLEAATDDHNVIKTTDNSQQHCNSHQSNAPTIQEVRDHHNQKPSTQPCKPSALIPPSYHPTPAPISPAEHSTLLPINNQVSWDRPVPTDGTNSSFVSQFLPPPCFQGPSPPTFDGSNSSFVSQSLPPPCFQGPSPPTFDGSNSSFVSQSLPPPCFQGPPPPTFDRSNSSFVRQSLTPLCFQGPPLPAFDRTDSFLSQSLPPPCIQGPPPPTFDRSNSSFVRQSLTPSCFQGPPPAFDRTSSSSFVSQSLPPASLQCPSPPAFDRTNSSFVSQSLPSASLQGPSPHAFDRTNSSFVSQSLPPASLQGPSPHAFDRTNSSFVSKPLPPPRFQCSPPPAFDRNSFSFVSKPLPPPCFQGSSPPPFDRTSSSFVSKPLPPPRFQRSPPPAFDRNGSSFVSKPLPPPRFQGSSPPPFDRTSSSFVSKPLPPPRFQRSPPPAFDRNGSSFVSKPLPPPRFQGSPPPAFDRTNSSFLSKSLLPPRLQRSPPPAFDRTSSFVSQSLPPASLQGPSSPAFDRTNSSFVSKPPSCFQGSPPHAFVGNRGPPSPRHNYPLTVPVEDDVQKSPSHENEKYEGVNDDHPWPTTQAPWHSSHVLPENRFSPQGRGFTESFTRPPFESSQHANQREDFYEQKGRHFNEILPQGGNAFHEQYPPRFRDEAKCTDSKRKLLILRGVPGSGKSTLARILLDQSPDGIVFSTDDYFCQEKGYTYDVKLLGDAHNWNQNREQPFNCSGSLGKTFSDLRNPLSIINIFATHGTLRKAYMDVLPFQWLYRDDACTYRHHSAQRAMDDEMSPIIIDNTNIQGWEMKPYVQMALESGYTVEFLEPDTWWKLDPHELEKRNTHRVPREKISQMLERFEHNMNVGVVMNSVEPRRVRHRRPPPEDRQRWGGSVDYTTHSSSFQIR